MVLNQLKGSQTFVVTRKWSLISNAEPSPSSVEDVKEGQILSGFVTNIVADAVFVRFLAGLTGRSGTHLAVLLLWLKKLVPLNA